jgi:hypothetical protein
MAKTLSLEIELPYNRVIPVSNNLSLRDLLLGARKREVLRLLLDRVSLSLAAAMSGLILLLLLGTQILEWYWVAVLVAAGIAVGIWRIGSALPNLYSLAQRIDKRLQLADVLSTAHYFAENPDPTKESVCRAQHRNAEETARTVDLAAVLPLERSRFLLPALALGAVALGLFAVRYMTTGSMSLEPSLVTAAYDTFFGGKTEQAKNLKADKKDNLSPQANAENSPENQSMEKDEKPPEDLLNSNDAENPSQGKDNSKESAESPKDKEEKGEDSNASDDQSGKEQSGDKKSQENGKDKQSDSNNAKESGSDQQPQSAMDKLKDAMQNLMNSMKPNKQDSQQQQSAKNQGKSQKSDQQQKGQKGEKSQSDPQAEASADQQGEEGSQQQSDNKSSQKTQDKNSQQDSKNGIGSQDGDKARKQAEQLEAMGKISQIIGQRSQQMTGEVTIEVGQSKQQLKTAWSSSQATHHDAGSETHRDEVPLAYQEFVRQYFDKIHNTGAVAPAPVKPATVAKPVAPAETAPRKAIPAP